MILSDSHIIYGPDKTGDAFESHYPMEQFTAEYASVEIEAMFRGLSCFEKSKSDINRHVKIENDLFVIYNTKVVHYRFIKRRTHYNKQLVSTIKMNEFPEPYLYIGSGKHRLYEHKITTTYQDAVKHTLGLDDPIVYQVPLDHLGGPEYFLCEWPYDYNDPEHPDPDRIYATASYIPKELDAFRNYALRLLGFKVYYLNEAREPERITVKWGSEEIEWDNFVLEGFPTL